MDEERRQKITNEASDYYANQVVQAINLNATEFGVELASEIEMEIQLKAISKICACLYGLNQDQTQFIADKMCSTLNETLQSIKSAPSSN